MTYNPGQEAAEAFNAAQKAARDKKRRNAVRDASAWVRGAEEQGFPLGVPQVKAYYVGKRMLLWVASCGLDTGLCQQVLAYVTGAYAVHKDHLGAYPGKWVITHVATGMFVHNPVWVGLGTDDQRLVRHGVERTMRSALALASKLPVLLTDQPFGARDRRGFKVEVTGEIRKSLDAIQVALVQK